MDQEYINKVEAYIGGKLTAEEKRTFDNELVENSDLAQVYREFVLAMDVVDQREETELKEKFRSWDRSEVDNSRSIKFFPVLWKVAASFILFAGIYSVYLQTVQSFDSYAELALSKYEIPESPGRTMGDTNELWSTGLDAYEKEDFGSAIENWTTIEKPTPEMQYFLAHAYFNYEEYENAAALFENLAINSNYKNNSDWYLLLTYLTMDNLDLFNVQFEKIKKVPNHPFIKDALKLKKKSQKLNDK